MSKHWFKARRYGYGVGLPTRWEGWALLLGYLISIYGAIWLADLLLDGTQKNFAEIAAIVALTIVLILIARDRTEGR